MENLLKNELFTHVSTEELEKMIPCFEMTKRSFREKDIIPTHEGGKNYICLLLSGTVSVNRISIDGSLDLLEYLEDTGVFGAAFAFANQEDAFLTICEKDCTVLFIEKHHISKRCRNACPHHTQVAENMLQLMSYFRIQSTKTGELSFSLPFSLLKLANYLCIDRSAMMREIKKMKEEELIAIEGKRVTLL